MFWQNGCKRIILKNNFKIHLEVNVKSQSPWVCSKRFGVSFFFLALSVQRSRTANVGRFICKKYAYWGCFIPDISQNGLFYFKCRWKHTVVVLHNSKCSHVVVLIRNCLLLQEEFYFLNLPIWCNGGGDWSFCYLLLVWLSINLSTYLSVLNGPAPEFGSLQHL